MELAPELAAPAAPPPSPSTPLSRGAGVQALSSWFGPRRANPAKGLPYECGIVPVETARRRLSVSFYVTAMLFIIFDVESLFLLPWATIVRQLQSFGIV